MTNEKLVTKRQATLREQLSLDEVGFALFLERAIPLLHKTARIYEGKTAFEYWYGIGTPALTNDEMGKLFGTSGVAAGEQVNRSLFLLMELKAQMDQELAAPGDYLNWKVQHFFTIERAIAAGLNRKVVRRIRNSLRNDNYEIVRSVTEASWRTLNRVPNLGPESVEAIKKMLGSVGLSIGS